MQHLMERMLVSPSGKASHDRVSAASPPRRDKVSDTHRTQITAVTLVSSPALLLTPGCPLVPVRPGQLFRSGGRYWRSCCQRRRSWCRMPLGSLW